MSYLRSIILKNGRIEKEVYHRIKTGLHTNQVNVLMRSLWIYSTGNGLNTKLRILCLHGFRQNASNFKGRTASFAKKLKNIAELVFIDAPHELPLIYQTTNLTAHHQEPPPSLDKCKKRFAWLVSSKTLPDESSWRAAEQPFDPLQYQQQTDGFEESYSFLKKVISQLGPFDGILGFSQGSAMAALFFLQQQRLCERNGIRFAILCSGFSAASEIGRDIIKCPSLHVFGDGRGKDRQIDCEASRKLAGLFDEGCSVVVEHDMGHIIPTRSPYIDQIKEFLQRFL